MIKNIFAVYLLWLSSASCLAEVETYSINTEYNGFSVVYPRLDLHTLDGIDLTVEKKSIAASAEVETVIKRVEFKLANATNLVATNLVEGVEHEGKYRAILTGPWVFKKLLVEVSAANFSDGAAVQYQVKAIDKFSGTNALVESDGAGLIFGGGSLIDTTKDSVVDVARSEVDGKMVVLKLLGRIKNNQARIEATWMGRGSRILSLDASHIEGRKVKTLKLGAEALEVIFEGENGIEPRIVSSSLSDLLNEAFGA